MLTQDEIRTLLHSTETYRIERTTSTGNMDKFCEAICAFANDLPDSRKKGYLLIGAHDDGRLSGLKVDDALLKKMTAIRSDGNILPLPVMNVERVEFPEGDLLVVEVSPSLLPPVRYRGRVFVRIGPRRDIASEAEERILTERRTAYMATFDATPCLGASLDDLDLDYVKTTYLPSVVDAEILGQDKRDIKEQLASVRLYDRTHDCPTYGAIILFGKNPRYYMPGDYVQYVRFAGKEKGGEVLNEKRFQGPLYSMLPALESFVSDAIVTQRPVAASLFREKTVINYPNNALRELMMNACMHRDYQSNMPIRLYQFDDHIEIMNAGGLYGEARPENFPMVNDYRNPVVAEAMKEMKYVNMFNQGVKRVQDMLRENGNREAVFDVSKLTVFCVEVYANEESEVSDKDPLSNVSEKNTSGKNVSEKNASGKDPLSNVSKNNVSEKNASEKDPLRNVSEKNVSEKLGEIVYGTSRFRNAKKMASKRTATKIIEQMLQNPQITASEIARNLGITQRTVERRMKDLRDAGVIKREGGRKQGYWKIIER